VYEINGLVWGRKSQAKRRRKAYQEEEKSREAQTTLGA
jgi:hypothetical protein